MAISAKDVMALRQRTGLGMMECKKALTETNGDMDAAVDKLRAELKGKMDERSDREAAEGAVAAAQSDSGAALIELISETDFAAKNDSFLAGAKKIADAALAAGEGALEATDEMKAIIDELRITIKENISLRRAHKFDGKVGHYVHHNNQVGVIVKAEGEIDDDLLTGICQHIAASVPVALAVDEAGLPADEVEKQRQAAIDEAKETGKPQEIAEKIATGKLRKWVDENTLMGQVYLREMDKKKPIRDFLPKGAKIVDFVRFGIKG